MGAGAGPSPQLAGRRVLERLVARLQVALFDVQPHERRLGLDLRVGEASGVAAGKDRLAAVLVAGEDGDRDVVVDAAGRTFGAGFANYDLYFLGVLEAVDEMLKVLGGLCISPK